MENKPKALTISNIQEVKKYSIAWFDHQTIAYGDVYLVDKVRKKIWLYQMNREAKDVTSRIGRRYHTDKDKPMLQQRIAIELYRLMMNENVPLHWVKVIEHSESAKEISAKLVEARLLQAEAWLRHCQKPVVWNTEKEAEENFGSI